MKYDILLITEEAVCVLLELHSSAVKSMGFSGSQQLSAAVAPSLSVYPKNGPGAKLI